MHITPELLLPAGSLEKMRIAYAYGADAVYAGQPRYSLRARNNEFSLEQLQAGIAEAHRSGKKFFVTSNLMPHNAKVKTYMADMAPVIALKPDALIMADPGLIMLVREMAGNSDSPLCSGKYRQLRCSKILANWVNACHFVRELSLDEVAEIRQLCPDMELEVFVHGALCIAYSGRCLLSGYFNHRDPNQGTCTNSCRWDYKVKPAEESASGDIQPLHQIDFDFSQALKQPSSPNEEIKRHPAADHVYLIEESEQPGQLMPIMEDEHGTYIMNSKDLRAVEHIERLVEMGINSLKIEGRTKSTYYVARTAQVYRKAIDDAVANRPFDPTLLGRWRSCQSRLYGWFLSTTPQQ